MMRLFCVLLLGGGLMVAAPGSYATAQKCSRQEARAKLTEVYELILEQLDADSDRPQEEQQFDYVVIARPVSGANLSFDPEQCEALVHEVSRIADMIRTAPERACAEIEALRRAYGL